MNVYRSPSGCQNAFYENLIDVVAQLNNLRYHDIYVLGDLNLEHDKKKCNELTSNLITEMQVLGFTQYNLEAHKMHPLDCYYS